MFGAHRRLEKSSWGDRAWSEERENRPEGNDVISVIASVFFPWASLVTFKHLRGTGVYPLGKWERLRVDESKASQQADVRTTYKFWFSLQFSGLFHPGVSCQLSLLFKKFSNICFSSVQSFVFDSLRPNELQHARPPCPSPNPRVHPNPHPLSQWCHPTISSSVVPFSSCPQSLPASGSFPMSQLFTWGGQSIGISASPSVLPMNTQHWSPLGWTGWISLQSKGTLKSLLQHHSSKASIIRCSVFFTVQLSHPY